MIKRWFVWLGIVSILIPFPVAIAQFDQLQLQAITVRIDVEGGYKEDGGSGVIVNRQGQSYTILTAYHVVETKRNYKVLIFNPSNQKIIGSHIINDRDIKQIKDYDLAEITIQSSAKYPTANIGDSHQLQMRDDVTVYGYPLPSSLITQRLSIPTLRQGKIDSILPPDFLLKGKRGATLKMDVRTEVGMSGGAVFNKNGELVGILVEADKDAYGDKSSSLAIQIHLYDQWQAIRNSQTSSPQYAPPTSPVTPYQDSQCSSQLAISSRYQPQKPIDIAYQPNKNYVEVDVNKLMNKSLMNQYDRQLVSFNALFGQILQDFWIYGIMNQVSQVEKSRSFLAMIISPRSFKQNGILIDKEKFDDILKIPMYSTIKIEGYATVRNWYSSDQLVSSNMLVEAHRIQVICNP